MKKFFKYVTLLAGLTLLVLVVLFALLPWMDRWGATDDEIAASLTGDELVPSPRITYTRAISINAPPKDVYPWIVQLGAEKGGMYSYEWFETNILQCELINADRIHDEWQNLKVGDPMKMCPGTSGPPPYEIAIIEPNRAIVMGHKQDGTWVEVWQFNFAPQEDGSTRLVIRSRSAAEGWFWDAIRPGEFIMMRAMMLGVRERAEKLNNQQISAGTGTPTSEPDAQHVSSVEVFDQTISLSYALALASQAETHMIPAVPLNDQILFSEAHPTFAKFRFPGYQNGRSFELPVYPFEAQVMVFQTADFPGYGDDSPQGFVNQKQSLIALLENGLDPARCARPLVEDPGLPFLPWVNMRQTFCAQPELIEFASGKGIRYITYYAQGPNPVLDTRVFYTFQGLTEDGQFYVSALFPIETGIFPTEAPACDLCGDPSSGPFAEMTAQLAEQLTQLNGLEEDSFRPSLTQLDDVIRSLKIAP